MYYCGKSSALGLKSPPTSFLSGGFSSISFGKWTELPVTKSPRFLSIHVGHEGGHALLLADDGSVFFVGTARRGEDGDNSK